MGAFKNGLVIGLAVGYFQGSKAGRQRYEQINAKMKELTSSGVGKQVADTLSGTLGPVMDQASGLMTDVMNRAAGIKPGVKGG